jgi:hypothetical protein
MSDRNTLEKLFEKLDIKTNLSGYSENDISKTLSLIQGKGKDVKLESLQKTIAQKQSTIDYQTRIASGGSGGSWKSLARQIRANMPSMVNELRNLQSNLSNYQRSRVIVNHTFVEQKQKEFDIKEAKRIAQEKRIIQEKKIAEEKRIAELKRLRQIEKDEEKRLMDIKIAKEEKIAKELILTQQQEEKVKMFTNILVIASLGYLVIEK